METERMVAAAQDAWNQRGRMLARADLARMVAEVNSTVPRSDDIAAEVGRLDSDGTDLRRYVVELASEAEGQYFRLLVSMPAILFDWQGNNAKRAERHREIGLREYRKSLITLDQHVADVRNAERNFVEAHAEAREELNLPSAYGHDLESLRRSDATEKARSFLRSWRRSAERYHDSWWSACRWHGVMKLIDAASTRQHEDLFAIDPCFTKRKRALQMYLEAEHAFDWVHALLKEMGVHQRYLSDDANSVTAALAARRVLDLHEEAMAGVDHLCAVASADVNDVIDWIGKLPWGSSWCPDSERP